MPLVVMAETILDVLALLPTGLILYYSVKKVQAGRGGACHLSTLCGEHPGKQGSIKSNLDGGTMDWAWVALPPRHSGSCRLKKVCATTRL